MKKVKDFRLIEIIVVVAIVVMLVLAVYSSFQWSAYAKENGCSKTGQKESHFNGDYLKTEYEWYCTKTDEYTWR